MGMYRHKMPDRELSEEMTKADYWEVQADMWHQNYKEANEDNKRLREALAFYAEWGIDAPAVDAIIEEDCGDKARAALNIVLGEKE